MKSPHRRADNRGWVEAALKKSPHLTDRELARRCGVTHRTVGKIRRGLESIQQKETSPPVDTFRRGVSQQTTNLLAWTQHILSGEDEQITIRHLFYRLVGENVIQKTETAYKSLVKHLSKWRRSGDVAWDAFADSTRWHIKPDTFDSMTDALASTAAVYRRNLWATQKVYVELWVEKDAMASVVSRGAEPFGVPVFVARGFASLSSLYNAAETFKRAIESGKRVIIYHFGDHDPSGVAAGQSMSKAFRDDFSVDVEFSRAAVTLEQIKKFSLPTRPTKDSSHSKSWKGGDSVELDAMPTTAIRALVEDCITRHIDQREWEAIKQTEKMEQGCLKIYADAFSNGRLFDALIKEAS